MHSLLTKLLAVTGLPRPSGAHAAGALAPAGPVSRRSFRAPPLGPVNPRRPLNGLAHQPRLHLAP